jgi:hypothetical protein
VGEGHNLKRYSRQSSGLPRPPWSDPAHPSLASSLTNPIATIVLAIYFPSLLKEFSQPSRAKISRESLVQKVKSSQQTAQPASAASSEATKPSSSKPIGRNIRLKRKELAQLLVDHLEELIVYSSSRLRPLRGGTGDDERENEPRPSADPSSPLPSLYQIRSELETNEKEPSFSFEEIEHFCFQLKDPVRRSLCSLPLCSLILSPPPPLPPSPPSRILLTHIYICSNPWPPLMTRVLTNMRRDCPLTKQNSK